jgi:hypothetical protein
MPATAGGGPLPVAGPPRSPGTRLRTHATGDHTVFTAPDSELRPGKGTPAPDSPSCVSFATAVDPRTAPANPYPDSLVVAYRRLRRVPDLMELFLEPVQGTARRDACAKGPSMADEEQDAGDPSWVARQKVSLDELTAAEGALWWLQGRPQDGTTRLMHQAGHDVPVPVIRAGSAPAGGCAATAAAATASTAMPVGDQRRGQRPVPA